MNEILKLAENKKIHSLFILKESGICIYSRNFTSKFEKVDIDLVTNFFAALFLFAEEVTSEKMENLEMVNVNLLFISSKDFLEGTKENLIFCLLADIDENKVFLRNNLIMVMTQFYNIHDDLVPARVKGTPKAVWDAQKDYLVIKSNELDTFVDSIMSGEWEIDSYEGYYKEVENYLHKLISENEILGAALLSITGNAINYSLSQKLFRRALKELEIRLQLGYSDLPLMIHVLEDGCKIFTKEIVNKEFLILHFDSSIPLGMCDITSNGIADHIGKLFKSWC
ncbi:MAG: hypothetical protein ACFFA4_05645 [Promethearchaeota archaeon]